MVKFAQSFIDYHNPGCSQVAVWNSTPKYILFCIYLHVCVISCLFRRARQVSKNHVVPHSYIIYFCERLFNLNYWDDGTFQVMSCARSSSPLYFVSSWKRPWCYTAHQRIHATRCILYASTIQRFLSEHVRKQRSCARDIKHLPLEYGLMFWSF